MKGFTKDGKFHPIKPYNKVRKSRDNTTKEQGVRKSRNRFHPKGYKPPTFGKKKPAGTWEITKTEYGSSKNVEITKDHVVIFDDDGREVVYWDKKEWEDEPEIKPIIKNYIKLANQGKVEEIKEAIKPRPEQRWDFNQRKARDELPEPLVETELTDIFDEVADVNTGIIDFNKLENSTKKNIEFILKRENRLGSNQTISVYLVDSREETSRKEFERTGNGFSGFYQYDYTIWNENETSGLSGTAYGSINHGEVLDMDLELYNEVLGKKIKEIGSL